MGISSYGKPIVTVPFPIINSKLNELIYVANNHQSFISSIEDIIKNGDKLNLSNKELNIL